MRIKNLMLMQNQEKTCYYKDVGARENRPMSGELKTKPQLVVQSRWFICVTLTYLYKSNHYHLSLCNIAVVVHTAFTDTRNKRDTVLIQPWIHYLS